MKKIIAVCMSIIMFIFIMPVNTEQTVLADTANEICNDYHEEIYSHDFIQYAASQTVTCPTCNGKYWIRKSEPCAHCNGTGKYTVNRGGSPCYGCSGKGTVPVYSTDANGNKIFKGNTACSVCRGTGSAPDNYVTNNCAYCNGSGLFYYNEVCPTCKGTGKITVTITTAPKITTNKKITTTTARRVTTTAKKVTTTKKTTTTARRTTTTARKVTTTTRKATTTTRKVTTTTKRATTTTKKATTTTTTSSKSKTNTTTAIQQSTTTIRTLPTLENDYDTFILLDLESGKYTIPFDSTGLTYKSTNPQVATVSNTGIITPVSVGTATITATNSKGKTATFSISVVQIATLTPKITTTVTTKKLTSTATTSKPSTTTSTSQTTTNTTTTMPAPVKYELGDINNDSKINAVDASTVLTYYAMVSTNNDGGFNDNQKTAADVNHDGSINAVDASCILSYYAYISTGGTVKIEEYLANPPVTTTKATTTTTTTTSTTRTNTTTTTVTSTTVPISTTLSDERIKELLNTPNVKCYFCGNEFFTSGVGTNGIQCIKCKKYFLPSLTPADSDIDYAIKYPGIWHTPNVDNHELVIHVMNSSTVVFSYMTLRGIRIELQRAFFNGNKAFFTTIDETEGYLMFNDNSISLTITKLTGSPYELTEVYTIKDLNSIIYSKKFSDIDEYYVQMSTNKHY